MDSIFDRSPLYLYSQSNLPPAGITQCDIELKWFANDTQRRFSIEPHPTLGPEDIIYRFNSKGYRCAEFQADSSKANDASLRKTLKVLSIGASEVFGVGLPVENTFPQVFCESLENNYGCNTVNWNLGVSGGSADYISRTLFSALPVLQPDIVLIVFPPLLRREYFSDDDRLFIYTDQIDTYSIGKRLLHRLYDPERSRQDAAHRTLSSDHSDQISFFKNYQLCEALCTKHDVMWLFSPFSELQLQYTKKLVNHDHLVLPGLLDIRNRSLENKEDVAQILARDLGHPGIKPNVEMAGLFLNQLQKLYPSKLQE